MALEDAWTFLKAQEPTFTYIGTMLGGGDPGAKTFWPRGPEGKLVHAGVDRRRIGLYSKGGMKQPMYQSTGNSSDMPGTWLPFHGINTEGGFPKEGKRWLIKPSYFVPKKTQVEYGVEHGYPENKSRYHHPSQQEAIEWANSQDLGDMEHQYMTNENLNAALNDAGASQYMHESVRAEQ